jgi:hypothetical protein
MAYRQSSRLPQSNSQYVMLPLKVPPSKSQNLVADAGRLPPFSPSRIAL